MLRLPCVAHCRQGVAPLIVMAVCNAATDLLIVIFPLPPILMASMPFKRFGSVQILPVNTR